MKLSRDIHLQVKKQSYEKVVGTLFFYNQSLSYFATSENERRAV